MLDKGFHLFDECATRCVHLSTQEEECTSSSWGTSKMYTSASITNSQRMLTVNKRKWCYCQIKEGDAIKHLKTLK